MKVVMYCQIGNAIDMGKFSISRAIRYAGLPRDEFDIIFVCWKTSDEVYRWLDENNYKYVNMEYDEGKGFLWNLYKGWNLGYEEGFKYSDYVCPIATDHAYYYNWLANLVKYSQKNRIVCCKLIEPSGYTIHETGDFGLPTEELFKEDMFMSYAQSIYQDKLIVDERSYGHRLDAMPFICPKDVWLKFGPMKQSTTYWDIEIPMEWKPPVRIPSVTGEITGDTDFIERCKIGGVQLSKSLGSISYHFGAAETKRNEKNGVYT